MMRRLAVLGIILIAVAAIGFNLPTWALAALALLAVGCWYVFVRSERSRS